MKDLIGRLLQLAAMVILPIGLWYGLGRDDLGTEVRLLALGGAMFVVGWLMTRTRSG